MIKDPKEYARLILQQCDNDLSTSREMAINAARSYPQVPSAFFADVIARLEFEHGRE